MWISCFICLYKAKLCEHISASWKIETVIGMIYGRIIADEFTSSFWGINISTESSLVYLPVCHVKLEIPCAHEEITIAT